MMPYGGLIWLKKKEGKEGIFRAIIVDGNYIGNISVEKRIIYPVKMLR